MEEEKINLKPVYIDENIHQVVKESAVLNKMSMREWVEGAIRLKLVEEGGEG